ncbi:NUDIX domain-containing protein [Virgibacillus halophilus]|uniref:NUDIX domain-containing protein n=1 Tax=Tigheibacillus halophilus TaxID=361280 RepID=A0ABU5C7S3_9BACI|nr:NUDIX domain-containing protein [Virgibacillus halophilus]
MEEGEYPAAGAKREAFEELGVTVNIKETFAKIEFHGTQYFFFSRNYRRNLWYWARRRIH